MGQNWKSKQLGKNFSTPEPENDELTYIINDSTIELKEKQENYDTLRINFFYVTAGFPANLKIAIDSNLNGANY